jgi:hypothetical protein
MALMFLTRSPMSWEIDEEEDLARDQYEEQTWRTHE